MGDATQLTVRVDKLVQRLRNDRFSVDESSRGETDLAWRTAHNSEMDRIENVLIPELLDCARVERGLDELVAQTGEGE
jgi:hypothetical protein